MRRRRRADAFGLSFLDCICCGFGAVILFYVMMSAQGGLRLLHRSDLLKSEVNRLQEQLAAGQHDLAVLRNTLAATQSELASAASHTDEVLAAIRQQDTQRSTFDATALARRARIEHLQADIQALEEGQRRLQAGSVESAPPGQDTHSAPGSRPAAHELGSAEEPRYLTGLRLHGKRILILVDRSASMLHEDLVSIIRLRNTDDESKRAAAKWRHTLAIVAWLARQLPAASRYQIYSFNTRADPLIATSAGSWLDAGDPEALVRNLAGLQLLVPRDGTSLINALAVVRALTPQPDQLVLITDGLPTQGRTAGRRRYIDSGAREHLFDEAIATLPRGVAVDTVLLPMKGDLEATHHFWQLARLTHGTLLAPSKDWP